MVKKSILSELAYEKIIQMLFDKIIDAGEKINKQDIVNALGISMTPINEAINRLIGEGILEQRNPGGIFVREFTYEDLRDLFAVRAGIEGVAIRLSIEKASKEDLKPLVGCFSQFSEESVFSKSMIQKYLKEDQYFHRTILSLAGNRFLTDLNKSFEILLKCYQQGLVRPPEMTLGEHLQIIDAVARQDAVAAQNLLMEHHLTTMHYIQETYL